MLESKLRQREEKLHNARKDFFRLLKTIYNKDELINAVCHFLVDNKIYSDVFIVFPDNKYIYRFATEAGIGSRFWPLEKQIQNEEFSACFKKSFFEQEVHIVDDVLIQCENCPLISFHLGKTILSNRIEDREHIEGVIVVALPSKMLLSGESDIELEKNFLCELCYITGI
ncbi:hypothetical protein JW979_04405, partial [bacterium]|nr:hypothetical protein [candidate division CSSED10-310 bacterium]